MAGKRGRQACCTVAAGVVALRCAAACAARPNPFGEGKRRIVLLGVVVGGVVGVCPFAGGVWMRAACCRGGVHVAVAAQAPLWERARGCGDTHVGVAAWAWW